MPVKIWTGHSRVAEETVPIQSVPLEKQEPVSLYGNRLLFLLRRETSQKNKKLNSGKEVRRDYCQYCKKTFKEE
jgi:hypothetical protein